MTRQRDIDAAQLAREAEPRRRAPALNRYVLGDPNRSRPDQALVVLCLLLLFTLVLVLWAGLFPDPPADADAAGPDGRIGLPILALALLIKFSGAALLVYCVLKRFLLLAALNIGVVTACVITTAMGAFDARPTDLPIEVPVDRFPAETSSEAPDQ